MAKNYEEMQIFVKHFELQDVLTSSGDKVLSYEDGVTVNGGSLWQGNE